MSQPQSQPLQPTRSRPTRSRPARRTRTAREAEGVRILIVDNEPETARALRLGLSAAQFTVAWAPSGAQALDKVIEWRPDVLILELALPDLDGVEVCRELRARTRIPIIVLSVRDAEHDKIAALEAGADDYVTKPFGMGEIIARVRVALRHAAQVRQGTGSNPSDSGNHLSSHVFRNQDLTIDTQCRRVTVGAVDVHLTPTEYDLLLYLAQHAGKVMTHRVLLRAIWGPDAEPKPQYLRVFINQLRRKLEPAPTRPRFVLTQMHIGYWMPSPIA